MHFQDLLDRQELDVKLNFLVNEVQDIYLEVYERIFPNNGEIKNKNHNKIDKQDTDKNIFFDKYLIRYIKAFNNQN